MNLIQVFIEASRAWGIDESALAVEVGFREQNSFCSLHRNRLASRKPRPLRLLRGSTPRDSAKMPIADARGGTQ